jgi:hypothetical protein
MEPRDRVLLNTGIESASGMGIPSPVLAFGLVRRCLLGGQQAIRHTQADFALHTSIRSLAMFPLVGMGFAQSQQIGFDVTIMNLVSMCKSLILLGRQR